MNKTCSCLEWTCWLKQSWHLKNRNSQITLLKLSKYGTLSLVRIFLYWDWIQRFTEWISTLEKKGVSKNTTARAFIKISKFEKKTISYSVSFRLYLLRSFRPKIVVKPTVSQNYDNFVNNSCVNFLNCIFSNVESFRKYVNKLPKNDVTRHDWGKAIMAVPVHFSLFFFSILTPQKCWYLQIYLHQ